MRLLATLVMSMLLVVAGPASAQLSGADAKMVTSAGPIAACPTPITVEATIHFNPADILHSPNHQIQYKWIDSAGTSYEIVTDTINLAASVAGTNSATVRQTFNWHSAGSFWIALQTVYPNSTTSNKVHFLLTCPSPGSLSLPSGE